MVYFDIESTLCFKMHAQFLIDNSIDIALKNFNYVETNMATDFYDEILITDATLSAFFLI